MDMPFIQIVLKRPRGVGGEEDAGRLAWNVALYPQPGFGRVGLQIHRGIARLRDGSNLEHLYEI
jgi:hypothetical protein